MLRFPFFYLTLVCSHKSTPYFRTKFRVSKTRPRIYSSCNSWFCIQSFQLYTVLLKTDA